MNRNQLNRVVSVFVRIFETYKIYKWVNPISKNLSDVSFQALSYESWFFLFNIYYTFLSQQCI